MASPTRWTWVWVNSRSWWLTGRPGVLQSMGSQRVGQDWATELKWIYVVLVVKNLSANAGNIRVASLIPGSGRFPWRRAWQPTSVFLSGESPWTEELGGLQTIVPQSVGHNQSSLAHTHIYTCIYVFVLMYIHLCLYMIFMGLWVCMYACSWAGLVWISFLHHCFLPAQSNPRYSYTLCLTISFLETYVYAFESCLGSSIQVTDFSILGFRLIFKMVTCAIHSWKIFWVSIIC